MLLPCTEYLHARPTFSIEARRRVRAPRSAPLKTPAVELLRHAATTHAASAAACRRLQHELEQAAPAANAAPTERSMSVPGSIGSPPAHHRVTRLHRIAICTIAGGWWSDEREPLQSLKSR